MRCLSVLKKKDEYFRWRKWDLDGIWETLLAWNVWLVKAQIMCLLRALYYLEKHTDTTLLESVIYPEKEHERVWFNHDPNVDWPEGATTVDHHMIFTPRTICFNALTKNKENLSRGESTLRKSILITVLRHIGVQLNQSQLDYKPQIILRELDWATIGA